MSYLSLKIFKDGRLIKTKIFTDDQISIGSSAGLSLQLEGLSPWHLLIEKKNEIFSILDLNSESGTMLNGEKITDESPLPSGSKISAGPYEFQFFIGAPGEKDSSPEAPSSAGAGPADLKAPSRRKAGKSKSPPAMHAEADKPKSPPSMPVQRPVKPSKKGFWNTYAPLSKIKNLDEFLEPSIGNLIEVIVCWKERILFTEHFFKKGNVFIGNKESCQLKFPNMLGQASYKLLSIAAGAKVFLSHGVRGLLFQGKDKATRTTHQLSGNQTIVLKPYEMVKLEFNDSLKVYVRLMDKPGKAPFVGLLNLKMSEAVALFLAFLLTGLLVFYGSLYAPAFLMDETKFVEKDIRVAKVIFSPRQVVEYNLAEKTVKAEQKPKTRVVKKKPVIKSIKKIKPQVRKARTPRKGKQGKIAGQAPGKKRAKKPKTTVGSVRPGGSLKTGKAGSSAKTAAPDPSKVGLLGAFGGGGKLSQLDKGATGGGGLLGLAEQSTGFAGTEESYEGEGIGTKTKDLGAGGQGSNVVGITNLKTTGKGLGAAGTGAGGLGQRGRMNIEFGSEDIDVTGEIDREAILQVLKRNQARFERCYQMSLNEKPSIQGNLEMQWLISESGGGRGAKAFNDPIGSQSLVNCVADVLEQLNFPEPPSGQTPKVTFPFRFFL